MQITVFISRFFGQLPKVDISETVGPNDLKFEVRIVLDRVPFQIKFYVIRMNHFREIDVGSWPKKTTEKNVTFFLVTLYIPYSPA